MEQRNSNRSGQILIEVILAIFLLIWLVPKVQQWTGPDPNWTPEAQGRCANYGDCTNQDTARRK
jgi:hypothetical protein